MVNLKLEAMGGLAAGVIGTVIGYPLDLIKTRMQTSTKSSMSNNMFQIGMNIVRKGIFISIQRGDPTSNLIKFVKYSQLHLV